MSTCLFFPNAGRIGSRLAYRCSSWHHCSLVSHLTTYDTNLIDYPYKYHPSPNKKGIDQDDDEYEESGSQEEETETDAEGLAAAAAERSKEAERETDQMAIAETKESEAAKKERMELIAAEQNALAVDHKVPNQGKATLEEKFHYLVSQSEVFAHFLAGEWLCCLHRLFEY